MNFDRQISEHFRFLANLSAKWVSDYNTGSDLLYGGAGDDALQGEAGNDSYVLARGSGQDTVSDYDATAGNSTLTTNSADVRSGSRALRVGGSTFGGRGQLVTSPVATSSARARAASARASSAIARGEKSNTVMRQA